MCLRAKEAAMSTNANGVQVSYRDLAAAMHPVITISAEVEIAKWHEYLAQHPKVCRNCPKGG
jgi:hypothetical protein